MKTPTLTPAAKAQLKTATALLKAIGLTPQQLKALARASEIAAELADREFFEEDATVDDYAEVTLDMARDDWYEDCCDSIAEAREYLAE